MTTYLPIHWAITAVLCYGIMALSLGYYMGRRCRACQQRKRQEAREEYGDVLPIAGKVSEPVNYHVQVRDQFGNILSEGFRTIKEPPTTDKLTDY